MAHAVWRNRRFGEHCTLDWEGQLRATSINEMPARECLVIAPTGPAPHVRRLLQEITLTKQVQVDWNSAQEQHLRLLARNHFEESAECIS